MNTYNINLDREKCILTITSKKTDFKEEDFDEFLILFESIWTLIKKDKLMCHLFINLTESNENIILPLQVYIKLANCLSSLNDTFNSHCHGISILTKNSELWNGIYSIIIKLWHPPVRRPIILTDKISEIKLFIKTNKLIK